MIGPLHSADYVGVPIWRWPEPEETAQGLLLRLAELNGYPSADFVAKCVGVRIAEIKRGEANALQRFAEAIRCDPDVLGRDSVRPEPVKNDKRKNKILRIRGIPISAKSHSFNLRRACPDCLLELRHHRFWWDIVPLTTCPTHGRTLAVRCSCREVATLSWRGGCVFECPFCKTRDPRMLASGRADPGVAAADAYVLRRFGIGSATQIPILKFDEHRRCDRYHGTRGRGRRRRL